MPFKHLAVTRYYHIPFKDFTGRKMQVSGQIYLLHTHSLPYFLVLSTGCTLFNERDSRIIRELRVESLS